MTGDRGSCGPSGGPPTRDAGEAVPQTVAEIVRRILDSLAHAFAEAPGVAERLSGQPVEVVHIVGGGSQNALLCRLTADACGRPVVAGPVEATAIGSVVVGVTWPHCVPGCARRRPSRTIRPHAGS